jgi:hypothetical protein
MRLPDEVVDAWRPVCAQPLGGGIFRVQGPCPADERWEFEPGTEVACEMRTLDDVSCLFAVRRFVSGWSVWRQDDHGGRFEVRRGLGFAAAQRLSEELEARGHKQTYWTQPTQ